MIDTKKIQWGKILLIVWVVFSICYVIYNEYSRLQNYVGERAYNAGITTAVNQLIEQTKSCQPIPVTSGNQKVQIISLDCLKNPAPSSAPTSK